jgi:hypothetical protein
MARPEKASVGRRNFLKGTVGGAAALAAASHAAPAQSIEPARSATAAIATEERDPSPSIEVLTADHPSSDFMVDVLKALGFEYLFANPGSSFRRLGPKPIAFTAVQRYIRQPTGQMPPYTAKVVSDKDLADVYAFLQSVKQPPAVKEIQKFSC